MCKSKYFIKIFKNSLIFSKDEPGENVFMKWTGPLAYTASNGKQIS
jgi:hypothetical protein